MIAPEAAKQGRELLRAAIDPLMKLSREVGADEAEEKA